MVHSSVERKKGKGGNSGNEWVGDEVPFGVPATGFSVLQWTYASRGKKNKNRRTALRFVCTCALQLSSST